MSESKHTPGPWKLCVHLRSPEGDANCPCGYRGGIWGSDGEHIVCEMGSTVTPGEEGMEPPRYDRPTELANARLIGAAPGLLEAAKRAVEILRNEGVAGWGVSKDILNEAIAKAEGRS